MAVTLRGGIDYHASASTEVLERYMAWNRPVLIGGMGAQLSKGNSFSLDFFQDLLKGRELEVIRSPSPKLRWDPKHRLPYQKMSFEQFRRQHETDERDGARSYLQDDVNNLPELLGHFEDPPLFPGGEMARRKLWISGPGLSVPLHYDPVETLHWFIRGRKLWVCFPPGVRNLYPHSITTTAPFISRADALEPDYERFPRLRHTTALTFVGEEGELLYIPPFWWHQVVSLDDLNVSMNFAWLASPMKNLRYAAQFGRCAFHLLWQKGRVKQAARGAASATVN